MMRRLLMSAIRFYQRVISPRKGFRCAYRAHTRRAGCSGLGLRAVRRYGAWGGLVVLKKRMHLCGVAHRRFLPRAIRPPARQRGDCDIGCDMPCDCDFPSLDLSDFFRGADCCSCDWPDRKDKGSGDKYVYIPPLSNSPGQRPDPV